MADGPRKTEGESRREHFIPVRRVDLVERLCRSFRGEQCRLFRRFDDLLASTFHFEYHRQLERLKCDYAPFDPDSDTKRLVALDPDRKERLLDDLVGRFSWLLERANFRKLSHDDIEAAMRQASHWGVNLSVDFKLFDRLEVFYRGESVKHRRTPRRWFGLRRGIRVPVPTYTRLVVLLRIKTGDAVPEDVDTNSVHIKVFKDIPKLDLEMLLPGTRVSMSLFDRIKLGFTLSTGIGMTGYKMAGPLLGLFAGATNTTALLGVAGGAVGYGVRSFYGYMQTKQKYMLTLAQSLYFLNLDNNAGVLFRLLDEAEEQECRETVLSYFLLLRNAGTKGWTIEELDAAAEAWLREEFEVKVDFEADDAVAKLDRLDLVRRDEAGRLHPVSLREALRRMDKAWDEIFDYNDATEDRQTPAATPRGSAAADDASVVV